MSDSRGEDADIHPYPGEDRPADPGAESMAVPSAGEAAPNMDESAPSAADEAALPSEQQGTS